jgi:hypothetical protein
MRPYVWLNASYISINNQRFSFLLSHAKNFPLYGVILWELSANVFRQTLQYDLFEKSFLDDVWHQKLKI